MPGKPTFSQYLLGHAALERPPFFYAYAGMWLHLAVGTIVLLALVEVPLSRLLSSMVLGSFCLGIVVYGLVARELGFLINFGSYGVSMSRLVGSTQLDPVFLVAAVLLALVSGYLLVSREYRRYAGKVFGDTSKTAIPGWISITMSIVVLLLCIFGLNLI